MLNSELGEIQLLNIPSEISEIPFPKDTEVNEGQLLNAKDPIILTLDGTEIEIIDNTEKTDEQELVEDLVQIITVFSCKLEGKRANKAKKMIKELLEDDNS